MACSCKVNGFGIFKNHSGFATATRIVMPRLTPVQREQAFRRLHAGHRPQLRGCWCIKIAIYALFNACDDVTMQQTSRQTVPWRSSYNTSGRQHMQDRFSTVTQTARQTIGIQQRPVSDDKVRRRLADHNLVTQPGVQSLHQDIVRNAYSGLQLDRIGGFNSGVVSLLTKADIAY